MSLIKSTADKKTVAKKSAFCMSLDKAWGWAIFLILLDGFFLGQGGIALLVVLSVMLGFVIAITRYYFFHEPFSKARLRNYGIYLVAALLVLSVLGAQNSLARYRGEKIVALIEAYQIRNHNYPVSLNALIPDYLEAVPVAKYTFGSNGFHYYLPKKGPPHFSYILFPPFYRASYDFDNKTWQYAD